MDPYSYRGHFVNNVLSYKPAIAILDTVATVIYSGWKLQKLLAWSYYSPRYNEYLFISGLMNHSIIILLYQ